VGRKGIEPQIRPAPQRGESHPPAAPAQRQVNSQDLQVTQGSEGSIFDAADLVVVQLPAERKGEDEGWPARAEPPRRAGLGAPRPRGAPPPPRSAGSLPAAGLLSRPPPRLCALLPDSAARYRTLKPVRSQ